MKPQPKVKAAAKSGPAGARSTTPRKKGACFTWRPKGYCTKGEACQWEHPKDQKADNPRADKWQQRDGSKGKRGQSTDPKRVCKLYLKGQCQKSHELCDFIHNPTCWFFQHKGDCKLGEKCLFPHRGDKGVLLTKATKAQHPPTGIDGQPGGAAEALNQPATAPSAKAKAGPKKGTATGGVMKAIPCPVVKPVKITAGTASVDDAAPEQHADSATAYRLPHHYPTTPAASGESECESGDVWRRCS